MPVWLVPDTQPAVAGSEDYAAGLAGCEHPESEHGLERWECGGYPPVLREQLATALPHSGSEEEQFESEMLEIEELVGFEKLFVAELAASSTEMFRGQTPATSKYVPAHDGVESVDI